MELTWDETDPGRAEVLNRKFSKEDLEKMDLHDYLASSSDEEGQLIICFVVLQSFKLF